MNLQENIQRIRNLILETETKSAPDEIVSGSYSALNTPRAYDAIHAFQSRRSDGFGGKLNTKVNNAIADYKKKYNVPVDIKSVDVEIDETELKVNWKVKIGKSKNGHHYSQIDSRGSAGGGESAVNGQLNSMNSIHKGSPELVYHMNKNITICFDNNGKELENCVCRAASNNANFCAGKLNIQQKFYKFKDN